MAFSTGNSSGDDGDNTAMPLAEMNMIPMIDVMLVLLIIMMVTAPFIEQGVDVDLPSTQGQSLQKDTQAAEEPVILFVTKDKELRLGSVTLSTTDLPRKLADVFSKRKSKELFVRADKDVPYGVVADVMARAKSAGIERVGLVTQPEQ